MSDLSEQIDALLAMQNETPRIPNLARDLLRLAASRIEELEEALEPFASEYDQRREHLGKEGDTWPAFPTAYRLMVGDLRKARAALSRTQNPHQSEGVET